VFFINLFLSLSFKDLKKYLETENLYKIKIELASSKKIKVYIVLEKYIKGIKTPKLNKAKK
jgi:hypothetical protein